MVNTNSMCVLNNRGVWRLCGFTWPRNVWLCKKNRNGQHKLWTEYFGFNQVTTFLAPPADWQRSFSKCRIVRHPSSSSTFHLKAYFLKNCPITCFLILHRDSMARGLPVILIRLESTEVPPPPGSPKMTPWLFLDILPNFSKTFQ